MVVRRRRRGAGRVRGILLYDPKQREREREMEVYVVGGRVACIWVGEGLVTIEKW